MKALLTFVLVASLAVAAGLAIEGVDGYVVFVVPPWRAQLSLTLFASLVVATVLVLYALLRLGSSLIALPRSLRNRREAWRLRRATHTLSQLVRAHVLGDVVRVHRLADRLSRYPDLSEAGAALATVTALDRGDESRAENWLARLQRWPDVRAVLEAEFGARCARPERLHAAMERLAELRGLPEATALRLRLEAAKREERWQEVLESARRLRALEAMDASETAALIRQAHLDDASSRLSLGVDLAAWWKRLPKEERYDPAFLVSLARLALDRGQGTQLRPILENALSKCWLPELVRLYPYCVEPGARQEALVRLEAWRLAHPEEPAVLEALVELCLELQLWGKAQDYLSQLRRVGADPAVLERFGSRLRAGTADRDGATLSAPRGVLE
ncbi:heme biosynthesis HemY N-terminal domain-containing protein [Tepidiphilus baoligensis]|jgi:HemY protein|uniref:HemY N-terminal domain-containing protein n=1 Tax=Tepidiphilus baoligensis TaxID=2698687 RepID=A0ABX1QR65_9PROT|nr:heme biosynthesis HemY N-terminal domain-containing protein [Tepidiphilus baoligensis]NMH17428.1 hypothetical protein [Tepidiphilus baoligensis]